MRPYRRFCRSQSASNFLTRQSKSLKVILNESEDTWLKNTWQQRRANTLIIISLPIHRRWHGQELAQQVPSPITVRRTTRPHYSVPYHLHQRLRRHFAHGTLQERRGDVRSSSKGIL